MSIEEQRVEMIMTFKRARTQTTDDDSTDNDSSVMQEHIETTKEDEE